MDIILIPKKPKRLTSHHNRSARSASRPKPTRTTTQQARTSACAARRTRSARRDGAATPTFYHMSSPSIHITRRLCSRRHQQSSGAFGSSWNFEPLTCFAGWSGCSLRLPILLCQPLARAKITSLDSVVKRSLIKSMNLLTNEVEAAVHSTSEFLNYCGRMEDQSTSSRHSRPTTATKRC